LAQAPRLPTLYMINRSLSRLKRWGGELATGKRAHILPLRQCTLLFMCRAASTHSVRLQLTLWHGGRLNEERCAERPEFVPLDLAAKVQVASLPQVKLLGGRIVQPHQRERVVALSLREGATPVSVRRDEGMAETAVICSCGSATLCRASSLRFRVVDSSTRSGPRHGSSYGRVSWR